MSSLKSKSPRNTYKDLLKINSASDNAGIDTTLRDVEGGNGVTTPLQLASDKVALHGKQWPVTGGETPGAVLKVSSDTTKLEWGTPNASSALSTAVSFFPGPITPAVGTVRWYPSKASTLKSVFMFVSNAPTKNIVVDVKMSGISIFSGPKPTITMANFTSILMDLNVNMSPQDYLTVDILSGDGRDLTVRFEYQ